MEKTDLGFVNRAAKINEYISKSGVKDLHWSTVMSAASITQNTAAFLQATSKPIEPEVMGPEDDMTFDINTKQDDETDENE
jgi:hypothetical protein